jgi:hypothetical protein
MTIYGDGTHVKPTSGQGGLDDGEGIKSVGGLEGLAGILGGAGKTESVWAAYDIRVVSCGCERLSGCSTESILRSIR